MLIHTLKKALMQGPVSLTRPRIDRISGLVCALVQVRSVHLRKLACSLPGMATMDSPYRRRQRFFSSAVSPSVFTELIVSKLVRPGQPQVLVMDRTHWKLGRTDLNGVCVWDWSIKGCLFRWSISRCKSRAIPIPTNASAG